MKKDSTTEVKIIRKEQLGESSLKGIVKSIAKFVWNKSFINGLLQMLVIDLYRNIQIPMGIIREAEGSFTKVDGEGGGIPYLGSEDVPY